MIGPLVVAAVAIDDDAVLRRMGVRDSKRMTPSQREALYPQILKTCEVEVLSLSAQEIDAGRLRTSLNKLEAEAFAKVLERFKESSLFIDCADVNERSFAETISLLLGPSGGMVCEHRADDTYPVVSAASIVAKVVRDRAISELEVEYGEVLGSGYPSDPRTIDFLERWINDKGNPPPFARCSWETTRRIMGRAKNSRLTDW